MKYPGKIILALLLLGYCSTAQMPDTVAFRFVPTFNKEVVQLGKNYFVKSLNDSVLFETLKFYVSIPESLVGNTLTYKPEPDYWLIDLEIPSSLQRQVVVEANSVFDKVALILGVDSNTNSSGAHGGDLDPTNGMYWSWQSGYINFRLEGKSKSCPARKNVFQYHLGGFMAPYNSAQVIELKINGTIEMVIQIALDELIDKVDIKTNYEIMSPGEKAMEFAGFLPTIFSTRQ